MFKFKKVLATAAIAMALASAGGTLAQTHASAFSKTGCGITNPAGCVKSGIKTLKIPKVCIYSSARTLSIGSRGSDVKCAQLLLKAHGERLNADGKFGTKTRSAVRDFQRKHHLHVDGVIGVATWRALGNAAP